METDRLRQFRAIVETGKLNQAAELLGMSHSGLSKSMQVLQNELGFDLFRPSGRGIVVTDQGVEVYRKSGEFLEALQRLQTPKTYGKTPVLRLGSFEVFTSFFIGPLLRQYLPNMNVEIHDLVPGRLEEALFYEKVDVGVTYEPIPREGIEYIKITSILMGAYSLRGGFAGMELTQIPFVVPVSPLEGAPSGIKGRDAWPDDKWERNICYRVDLMSSGLELVRQGLCAIFIPRFVAQLHNHGAKGTFQLELLDAPKKLSQIRRDVYIVKREAMARNPALDKIAEALRTICAGET